MRLLELLFTVTCYLEYTTTAETDWLVDDKVEYLLMQNI